VPDVSSEQVYVVVLHAESAARFANGEAHRIAELPTPHGQAAMILRTDFEDEGLESPVPRSLWLEIAGTAPTIEAAVADLGRVGANFGPSIALAANAHVGDFRPYLAFDATPDRAEREFFQNFIRKDTRIPQAMRLIPWEATWAFMDAVAQSPYAGRLQRGIAQYGAALARFRPGHETFAHAHLYMGMEAITKVAVRWEADRRGLTEAELVADLGLSQARDLDSYARREILFGGDRQLVREAREASDGFEHGFEDLEVVHRKASNALMRTAELLRNSILTFSGIREPHLTKLREAPYNRPMPWSVSERYIRGTIVSGVPNDGSPDALARSDKQYPMLEVTLNLTSFAPTPDGHYQSKVDANITPLMSDSVKLSDISMQAIFPESDVMPASESGDTA
jgi:hypothetical protein